MKQYNFQKKIGEGTFAEVWRVTDASGVAYACKRSRSLKLLRQEAEYMRKLRAPVFPRFQEYRETELEGQLFMELVQGITLTQWVLHGRNKFTADKRQMLREEVVRIGLQLAEGLSSLQEREPPLVYRDLKPDNIIITDDGKVRVVDLGLICPEGVRGDGGGSPGFAAPEQFAQGTYLSGRADVYAWGKVMEWLLKNCKMKEPEGTKLETSFHALLQQCTAHSVAERPASMRFLKDVMSCYDVERNRFCLNQNQKDILRGKLVVRKSVVRMG